MKQTSEEADAADAAIYEERRKSEVTGNAPRVDRELAESGYIARKAYPRKLRFDEAARRLAEVTAQRDELLAAAKGEGNAPRTEKEAHADLLVKLFKTQVTSKELEEIEYRLDGADLSLEQSLEELGPELQ